MSIFFQFLIIFFIKEKKKVDNKIKNLETKEVFYILIF